MFITDEITAKINDPETLVIVNHSGGKDSQAMLIKVLEVVPAERVICVHADLGRFEWDGTHEHAAKQCREAGVPLYVAEPIQKDGSPKDFLTMVESRLISKKGEVVPFPSASCRQCTSDLKRDPIAKVIRREMKARGLTKAINAQGIRAEESVKRSKETPWELNTRLSAAGREVFDWFPIFELTTDEVKQTVADAGQELHWAYGAGNDRLSCVFCIMGSKNDLINGYRHRPELFAELSAWEEDTGYTMHQSRKSLKELVNEAAL